MRARLKTIRNKYESQVCAFDPEGFTFGIREIIEITRMPYHVVVGITSFGQMCGSDIPGVYTRVFTYLDWIEGIVWADVKINNNVKYTWL